VYHAHHYHVQRVILERVSDVSGEQWRLVHGWLLSWHWHCSRALTRWSVRGHSLTTALIDIQLHRPVTCIRFEFYIRLVQYCNDNYCDTEAYIFRISERRPITTLPSRIHVVNHLWVMTVDSTWLSKVPLTLNYLSWWIKISKLTYNVHRYHSNNGKGVVRFRNSSH